MNESLHRIVFDPGGPNELVLVDWGELTVHPRPPWQQRVDRPKYVEAQHADVIALGGVSRDLTVSRAVRYAEGHEEAEADVFRRDAAMPAGKVGVLEIRVLDLTAAATGTVQQRTATMFRTTAAIKGARPVQTPGLTEVTYQYTIAVGKFVEVTPVEAYSPKLWLRPGAGIDQVYDASADHVAQWRNKGSIANAHALRTVPADWPLVGSDNKSREVPDFDGAGHMLQSAFGEVLVQELLVAVVVNVGAAPNGAHHRIFDGIDTTDRVALGITDNDKWGAWAGTGWIESTADAATGRHLLFAVYDGASSVLRVNGAQVASGDVGSKSLAGVTLAAKHDDTLHFDGTIEEVVVIQGPSDTAAAIADVEQWLNANHQLGLSL